MIYSYLGIAIYFSLIGLVLWRIFFASAEKKASRATLEGLALGTNRFGAFAIAAMLSVTMLGPADFLALSKNGYDYGAIWTIFPLGAALALFVSGRFFVERIYRRKLGKLTVGDIIGSSYGRTARLLTGITVVLQTIAFSGVLIIAGGQVLDSFLGIDPTVGMILTAIFVGLYTSLGGMDSVTSTDKYQFRLVAFIFILILISVVVLSFSSPLQGADILQREAFAGDFPLKVAITFFLTYFLGELLLPTYTQRVLISESADVAKRGFLLGSFFLVLWYVLITYAGSLAHLIPLEVRSTTDEIIVVEMTRAFLVGMDVGTVIPGLIGAIVFAALLALIHSTYDSFLQVGAATFARDVLGTFIDDDPKLLSWVGKQAAIGISVLGLIIGVFFDSIIDALIFGYTIWVPSLLGPFLFCIFSKKESFAPRSFIAAYLLGVTAWIVCDYVVTLPWYFSYVPGIAYGLLLSLVTLFLLERNQTVVSVEAN